MTDREELHSLFITGQGGRELWLAALQARHNPLELRQCFLKVRFGFVTHQRDIALTNSLTTQKFCPERSLCLFHPAGDGSGSHAGANQVACFHLAAGANQRFSVGQKREAIAACEDAQWAECLEAGGQSGNAVPPVEDILLEGQPDALGEVLQSGRERP